MSAPLLPHQDSNLDLPVNSRMLCRLSYRGPATPIVGRILDRVESTSTGCWTWTGALNSRGYGLISVDGTVHLTHRLIVEEVRGPIPSDMQIDHLCSVKACCNPEHLEVVTPAENVHRSGHGVEPHCLRGHALSGPNLLVKKRGDRPAVRNCRTCRTSNQRAYRKRTTTP